MLSIKQKKVAITKNPFSVYFASLDKIDRADLEDIACKFFTSFEFAKMADLKVLSLNF